MKDHIREIIIGLIIAVIGGVIVAWVIREGDRFGQPPTPIPTLTSEASSVVVVYPVCQCEETVKTTDAILIRLRWGATTKDLATISADSIIYRLTLNGNPVDILQKYQQPPLFVAAEDNPRSSSFGDAWYIYWDVPIGTLSEGEYVIEAEVVVIKTHSDGKDTYQPGALGPLIMKLQVVKP